jgi:methylenetetrahydrofolate dehydrogenase (NADP+) / methenyltetrahydrofolate cyclohydrolase
MAYRQSDAATKAMIVNGRKIAKSVLARVKEQVAHLPQPPIVRAIVLAPSPATESYLRIKERRAADAGMRLELVRLADDASVADAVEAIERPGADAVIVQLPLPEHIDTIAVLDAVPRALDADVLSLAARTAYAAEEPGALRPPVVAAIAEIMEQTGVQVTGTQAVVIGNGWLVGAPAARWLRFHGAHVEVITLENADYAKLKEADIVVSGAGSPGLIRPEQLKKGVVLIDAGTSESRGQMVGDADPACAEVASVFTPVPGGVGPVAVACLFENVSRLLLARV